MLGMQQTQSYVGHHVPSSCPPLAATSISCGPDQPTKSGKPRLKLNTTINNTQTRTFGRGSSLRLDTLSAISPTIRNTFSNAYERQPDIAIIQEEQTPKDQTSNQFTEITSASSISSSSTVSLECVTCPYTQPSYLKSILINSSYPKIPVRRMSVQKPLFPLRKRVSFREPLDEEIKTSKYTLAHSDLDGLSYDPSIANSSKDDSYATSTDNKENSTTDVPALELPSPPTTPMKLEPELQVPSLSVPLSSPQLGSPRRSPRLAPRQSHSLPALPSSCPRQVGHKRDSSSSSSEDDDGYTHTPVASRCKRRRWQWTLGPLPGYQTAENEELKPTISLKLKHWGFFWNLFTHFSDAYACMEYGLWFTCFNLLCIQEASNLGIYLEIRLKLDTR